jgi:hypothetical protein
MNILDDYKSPRELAEHLKLLISNRDEWNAYFLWKNNELPKKFVKVRDLFYN